VIAGLTRIVHDVGVAEELAQDALVVALEKWPESGIPENPGAWLMGTAKHRAIDFLRRSTLVDRKHEDLGREMAKREMQVPDLAAAMDNDIGDDMLRLVFIACHPVLSTEARVALTLRLLGGLTTDEIARLPGPRGYDGAADRSSEADPHRCTGSIRNAPRFRIYGATVVRFTSDLPHFQ
jgi:predicted RNA polymerase sigma factor